MLLQRLHDFGDITWDDRGKIDGSTVKGENIVDLINDAMRYRKQPLSNGSSPQSDSDDETQQSDSEKANEKPYNRSPLRKLRKRLRPEETPRHVKKFVVFHGIT